MDLRRALALLFLLAAPGSAAVHLSISSGPLDPDAVNRTEAASAQLLETPVRAAVAGRLHFTAASWKKDLAPAERERLLRALEALWGRRFTVREEPPASGWSPAPEPPPSAYDYRARAEAMRSRLGDMSRPLGKAGQDRFYDGSRSAPSSVATAVGAPAPAPARSFASSAGSPTLKIPPPPPAPATPAAPPISWKRAGIEMLKGAGHTIAEVFTWKGLAVAAASVALVTLAPITIYGLLALGAAFAGWTIGKALINGTAAYKAGSAEGFYAASREMGRGALALGLTLMGARHAPTSLRPHFPRTSGEWRAMAAAVDDEPIVAMSILRGRTEKQ